MAQLRLKVRGPDFEISLEKEVKLRFEVDPLFKDSLEIYIDDHGWLDLSAYEAKALREMVHPPPIFSYEPKSQKLEVVSTPELPEITERPNNESK